MKNCNDNNARNTLGLAIVLGGFALAAGCGDAGASDAMADAENSCEAGCARADACPTLYAESDCVSECELAREQAATLGGTCGYALEDFLECYNTLSCDDIGARTRNPNNTDACTSAQLEVTECEPWSADETPEPVEPDMEEIRFACRSFCESLAACSLDTEADCESVCVMTYAPYQAHSPACAATFVDAYSCYSSMQCSELVNRANDARRVDSCTAVDDYTINVCAR